MIAQRLENHNDLNEMCKIDRHIVMDLIDKHVCQVNKVGNTQDSDGNKKKMVREITYQNKWRFAHCKCECIESSFQKAHAYIDT